MCESDLQSKQLLQEVGKYLKHMNPCRIFLKGEISVSRLPLSSLPAAVLLSSNTKKISVFSL